MRPRVAITGLGAVSGFGFGVPLLWQALVEGRRAMRPQPAIDAAGLGAMPVALVPSVPWDAPDRAIGFALAAAREAAEDAGGLLRGARLGVVLGTTLGGIARWLPAVRDAAPEPLERFGWAAPAHAVAEALGASGPVEVASVACASGNAALGNALDLLRQGRADVVVAGGADALHDFVVSGFQTLKAVDADPCRPFDRRRRGLNLGEGAAFLVLETAEHAAARGARVRAWLDGYGVAADAVHMTGPDREGRGAARAMQAALADAGVAPEAVDYVSAHGTATVFNDLMEGKALTLALGARAATAPTNSVKGNLGHALGAAGAIEAVVCVRTLETGLVTPTPGLSEQDPDIPLTVVKHAPLETRARHALSTSSGFGGTNTAILLSR
jgi:3-oxoacyl-[acyl-carrier-protein] synthase II